MPLRFSRPVMALIATGTAAVTIGMSGVPAAHADQIRTKEWWLRKLDVTRAWTASRGAGVTVAVLSDGVVASDADLGGAVTAAPAPSGAPRASGQYFGEAGTPIASLIAGRGHGSGGASGILGVAPAAKILSIPVTLPAGDPQLSESGVAAAIPGAIAAGIRSAVRRGATVIDLPIDPGQPDSSGTPGASAAAGGSRAEQSAVSYALAHNVAVVAPAGDDGTSSDGPNYPAAYSGVIAVGAFDSAFTKAPWSSHRSYVTVTAPGAGVLAAANSGGYQTVNSTSAASAIVAGITALIRARYPGLSVDQVRGAITTSTVYGRAAGRATGSGYGTVNASKAMAAAALLAPPKGSPAGAGARPLVSPAAVPAASATKGLTSQVLRAGEISAALFVALLLLIIAYAATGRRRRRPVSSAVVSAQWAHRQGQSRYPQVAAPDADRMLEAFATPPPEPDRAGLASGARVGGSVGSRADSGMFAPAGGRLASGSTAGPAIAAGAPAESGAFLSHSPATRAVSRRPVVSGAPPWEVTSAPRVSGTPPWEPASAPNSELPWTAAPGRHSLGGRPAPAALPGGQTDDRLQEGLPGEPPGQSDFRSAGQPDPGHAGQHGWQDAASQVTPAWDSPGASPSAARDGLPDHSAAQRGGEGWDGVRWNPAPAVGPVIEGSVLSSGSVGRGRASSASYPSRPGQPSQYARPDQYSQPGQHARPDQHAQPGQYSQRDLDRQFDWRGRQAWPENQASGSHQAPADATTSRRSGQDWPGPDRPEQPRIAPSGLPVRTPRPAASARAPLSPSGSLWERAESESGNYQDPGDYQITGQDAGGRPIYVWNPEDRPSAPGYPPETELPEGAAD